MTLQFGFIGVGGIAEVHLRNITSIDGANVQAVFDVNAERTAHIASKYNAKGYTNLHQMLESEKLDGVYVCIPPFAHGEAELAVVEHGLPMLVEKPLSIQTQPALQVLQAIEERNLLTAVGYHWRYSQAAALAKEALSGRVVGMALGYWLGGMPMVSWWRKMDGSGGQMVEQTTHIVDLARYLLGEVEEVYAAYADRQMQQEVEGVTVPDVGTMTLRFQSGVIGTISNTCLLNQGYTVGLDVLTRDLVVEVRGDSLTERRGAEVRTRRNTVNPYLTEDEAFVDAIRTGNRSLIQSTYKDAFETHRVTVAANESAASGKPIKLSDA